MMTTNVRVLVVAATFLLLGFGVIVAADEAVPQIGGLSAEHGATGPVIHLDASSTFDTVHYSPQPGVWVVEMPEMSWGDAVVPLSRPGLGIEQAELSLVDEFGKRLTRLTVWLTSPAQLVLLPRVGGLDLELVPLERPLQEMVERMTPPVESVAAHEVTTPDAAENELVEDDSEEDGLVELVEDRAEQPIEPVADSLQLPGVAAASLLEVVPTATGSGLVMNLVGDGSFDPKAFELDGPDRLVIDLEGVVNRVDRHVYPIGGETVRRVRVAQHQAVPVPITRVVVDLARADGYLIEPTGDGARITVGDASSHSVSIAPPQPAMTIAAPQSAPIKTASVTSPPAASAEGPSRSTVIRNDPDTGVISVDPPPRAHADRVATASQLGAPLGAPASTQQASLAVLGETEPAAVPGVTSDRNPWVADSAQLIERAPAAQLLDAPTVAGESYATTEVETDEKQFTGEPITLTLKDADVKDVLRTFSALTQLNIVLDPGVSGSVTVELRDVPWDQALDIILRVNNLDYVLENNVLRIAPTQRLASEKAARAAYEREAERAKPLKTVVKPLSYAKADYVSSLLTGDSYLLSDRGSVVVDERTNTLILRDVVDRVEGVLRLIETLDQPTPQVVIEGRIVETTRRFSRELGINWGFTSTMDAEHGNSTGLEFPNTVTGNGRVSLLRGSNGVLSFTFGDILDTFNLDFTLAASESTGTVRIVSTPRITTQNLQQAQIRSGVQVPVQTSANNTVTVQYVDATLNLQVTPQITAEGTVNLEVNIKKQRPIEAFSVQGSQNLPIFTREARTQLLIRDGGTTVIGGIYQLTDDRSTNRVPGLAKIPVLGSLFKNKGYVDDHDELLIFITPRIVKY